MSVKSSEWAIFFQVCNTGGCVSRAVIRTKKPGSGVWKRPELDNLQNVLYYTIVLVDN